MAAPIPTVLAWGGDVITRADIAKLQADVDLVGITRADVARLQADVAKLQASPPPPPLPPPQPQQQQQQQQQ